MKQAKKILSKIRVFMIPAALYLIVGLFDPGVIMRALVILKGFALEMVQVLPAVFILSALINEWVPAATINKHLGKAAGFRGMLAALLLGSISAGPIYAAFPMAQTLQKKGASTCNVVIIISSWAVVKLPMLMMEMKFLGPRFTVIRYIITVPAIFLLGWFMGRVLKAEMKKPTALGDQILPGHNCRACGYKTCMELLRAKGAEPAKAACIFIP